MAQDANTFGYSARVARRSMNRLIAVCKEDVLAEEDARRAVRDPAQNEHLRAQAHERGIFIEDLERAVRSLGGAPAREATALAWARSLLRHLRSFVGGWHEGDAYAAMTHAEERTAEAYLHALSGSLPEDIWFGVSGQFARIDADRDAARRLWGMH